MIQNIADHPIAYFHMPTEAGERTDQILRVAEIIPEGDGSPRFIESLTVCSTGVRNVIDNGWSNKFVRTGVLRPSEVGTAIKTPYQQKQAIEALDPDDPTRRAARYFITSLGGFEPVTDPLHVRAVLRMEMYQPKLPTVANPLRRPYPNITDIETSSGQLAGGPDGFDALALMRTALRGMRAGHKVAAYTERENPDGIDFLKGLGFKDRTRDQYVSIGAARPAAGDGSAVQAGLHYVHMEASKAGTVQETTDGFVRRFVI
jgi:hypothetical protein